MRSPALRLYVVAITLLVFFVLWAAVAAKPWVSNARASEPDPRIVALDRRQRRLAHEASLVRRTLDRRWSAYRMRLRRRERRIRVLKRRHAEQLAAASLVAAPSTAYASGAPSAAAARVVNLPPAVRVVTLPPAASASTSSGSSRP